MFANRNKEGEDYSFYWLLPNKWTDNMKYEDDETMDTERRKLRRGDKNVTAENNQVVPPAASQYQTPRPPESPTEEGLSQSETDHPALKREIIREKNKYAARKCRQKKKEYLKRLEDCVATLENQNKTLMEELNSLRDLYCVKTE